MQNEEKWKDILCEVEEQGVASNQECHFPGELEDDVEVFFMMMLGLG